MSSATILRPSYRQRSTLRSRASAMALALGVVALVILLLIQLGVLPPPISPSTRRLIMFDAPPAMQPEQTHARTVAPIKTVKPDAGSAAPRKASPSPPPPAKTTTPVPDTPLLQLSDNDFSSSDIGKIAAAPKAEAPGAGGGSGSGAVYGPGEGPGGAPMYAADWYRRPTHTEIGTYLPKDGPDTGYGLIACKTIADYHVDNCRVLSETPGSGFGTAIRRAAWQFLVLPPRVGAKPMIGAWVKIEIDITPGGAELH
jgi:hypothetical protein